ncbi:serine hydrolase [Promicromonospora sp. NPDC050880]|uniref:serine hydrolase n=1 Tax=Promicromonospora sp. NPDC050880 TaxID=3364406 RepID=UPI0037B53328
MTDLAKQVQTRARALVDRLVAEGDEVGLQVAVVHRGRLVVDAAGGPADPERGLPATPGTLFFAASAAKSMASTVAHVLAELFPAPSAEHHPSDRP